MRGPTGRTQWVALLMVLTQTLALSPVGAFQLWPIRLTRPLASSKQGSNWAHDQNQRQQTSTTTTTSTSTTTSAPHAELVFLVDTEDLGQQELDGRQDQQALNDTMILEEVVNHIHRNIKLNSNENCTNCAGQDSHKLRTISEFEQTNQFLDERANKSAQYKMNYGQSEPTTTPATTLAEVGKENNRLYSLNSNANETANETLSDPDDDRHIQYDTIVTSSPISYEELRRQQVSDSGADQMTMANFTLAIEDDRDEGSQEVSDPLVIISPIRNASVNTPTTDQPPNQYQSNASSPLSQHKAPNTSQAQARSMSGVSSHLPQHSKAPYATNNLFNHPRQDPNDRATETTPTLNGNLTGKTASTQSINRETSMSNIKQSNDQLPVQQAANSTLPVRNATEGSELANSISKISSYLAGESSRNLAAQTSATSGGGGQRSQTSTNVTATQTAANSIRPMSLVDKSQAYLNGNVNFSASRQEPSSGLERVVSKLAPTNELVELDPLPSPQQGHAQAQTPLSERYYSTPSGQNQQRDRIGSRQGDRYPTDFYPESDHSEYHHQMAHSEQSTNTQLFQRGNQQLEFDRDTLKNVAGELPPEGAQMDEQVTTAAPILHRKTFEILSNQIKNSDNSLLASSSNTMAVHQHKERSPPAQQPQQQHILTAPVNRELNAGSRHHQATGGTFAASLINVTAPMVLPLSASEAMENSIAAQFQLPHQSGRQENQQRAGSTAGQHPAPHRSNYYVIPQPSNMAHESIYMRPMNQFRPTAAASSTQAPNGQEFESERTRLEHRLAASQLASGFRSPQSQFNPPVGSQSNMMPSWSSLHGNNNLPTPASYLNALEATSASSSLIPMASPSPASVATTLPSVTTSGNKYTTQATPSGGAASNKDNMALDGATRPQPSKQQQQNSTTNAQKPQQLAGTTNGFITGTIVNTTLQQSQTDLIGTVTGGSVMPNGAGSVSTQVVAGGDKQQQSGGGSKRAFNLTRVEHISAECSSDLIRTIIIFNGTFKGIIYSSGYVRDPNCLYINGTGKTRYDFSIKLNQCGTLGRQELHSPTGPDEVRRRDQVMWNSLSIQYNPIIEQEWDEHFRVSCEYGSDFWKTISFNPFNVETNTGSPVVFTVDPPQCQMEILKGHGMVGPRQEATSGPVTVGDPLTLLIHMKSEKAGYDILVKNCIAHDGSQQKMQLIDSNGCVVNERFISPFRGTYNDQDLKHVTLYSYLKAFRFTGSPVLYLECEVHMCQSACPPQMCYWRSISKRSIGGNSTYEISLENSDSSLASSGTYEQHRELGENLPTSTTTETSTTPRSIQRKSNQQRRTGRRMGPIESDTAKQAAGRPTEQKNLSDKISLTRALEVRQDRFTSDPTQAASGLAPLSGYDERFGQGDFNDLPGTNQMICYQRIEIFAFLFTVASILLAAVSVTIGCYCRASNLKRQSMTPTGSDRYRRPTHQPDQAKPRHAFEWLPRVHLIGSLNDSANLCYSPMSSVTSPLSSPIAFVDSRNNDTSKRSACSPYSNSSDSTRPQIYGRVTSSFNNLLGADSTGDDLIWGNRGPSNRPPAANYINQRSQLARRADAKDERLLVARRS